MKVNNEKTFRDHHSQLLLSGNAYASVNEPGVTSIAESDRGLKLQYEKIIKKNQTGVLYASYNYD